jgi:SHS family lactate transporter-like MFS transporter
VQGAWGVVPIYLSEISPPAFRASFAGIAYQLGNMASAGSAQIVATGAQNLKLKGTNIADYATIQGIFIGCVIGWLLVMSFLGPDADGSNFEKAKIAIQSGAGEVSTAAMVARDERPSHHMYSQEHHHVDLAHTPSADGKPTTQTIN